MLPKDLIRGNLKDKLNHIGSRVKFFRECKELPIKLLAERCGVAVDVMCDIEMGNYFDLDTATVLKISEVLGTAYVDFFETDGEKYYSNLDDSEAVRYVFRKAREMKITQERIMEVLDVPKTTFKNFSVNKRIPSPFVLGNLFSLLKITADELLSALKKNEDNEIPSEVPTQKEESKNMMDEVVKAINFYKSKDAIRAELDEIVARVEKLKSLLEE